MTSHLKIHRLVDQLADKHQLRGGLDEGSKDDREGVFFGEAFKLLPEPSDRFVAVLRANGWLAYLEGGPTPNA